MQVDKSYEFKTAEEAWNYTVINGHRAACMYNYDENKLMQEVRKLYNMIEEFNKTVDDIDKQLLPTYPYWYRKIDRCLGVYAAEIDISKVEDCMGCIAFCGYNESVLNIPNQKKYNR